MAAVFADGTLLDAQRGRRLLGRASRAFAAVFLGYRREAHPEGPWPVVVPDSTSKIRGTVLDGLDDADLGRLDRYEGVDRGLSRRVRFIVHVGASPVDGWAYVKV